jgi:hypothetical protein
MRKTMLLTCLLLLTGLTTVHAGRRVMLGVRGGFELTEMNFNAEDLRESNRVGFYFGPSIEFALPLVGLGIDISALYSRRSLKVDDQKVTQKYIQVPANLRFGVEIGDVVTVFASAGPQLGMNIGKDIFHWKDEEDMTNRQFLMQNTMLSFNFGFGVHLENHLEAGVYYNVPVGKAADFTWDKLSTELKDTTWSSAKTKTNAWHISLTYFF